MHLYFPRAYGKVVGIDPIEDSGLIDFSPLLVKYIQM